MPSGTLTFRGKIYVLVDAAVKYELIKLYYNNTFVGYFGAV
ncbi:hypothetical protein Vi05172_g13658 [Venturia inaequalis]|nr:hypothetical protein Vi05172_g13658 [Venturia inaequalis]